jgi:hypothetical protein
MNYNTSAPDARPAPLVSLAAKLAEVTDQRKRRGIRYQLVPLLVLVLLAKLCGADTPQAIAEWVAYRADGLKLDFIQIRPQRISRKANVPTPPAAN